MTSDAAVATAERTGAAPILSASGVTMQFGGLRALGDVSFELLEGQIIGLIGPNGAGKTTLFNAILGLNSPAEGTIAIHGRDVSGLSPHLRARLGVARTFQVLQLFNELSVFDNLLVATHLHNSSGIFSNLSASRRTLVSEAEARERVREILRLLDLEALADEGVRNLPFGILRMVELGRALVTGGRLLMLDEIASGLNEGETDRLSNIVTTVRSLGVSILLIEHDIRMVTGISDHIFVLNQGTVIADGPPAAIQRDPQVIAAYLGEAPDDAPAEPEVAAVPS